MAFRSVSWRLKDLRGLYRPPGELKRSFISVSKSFKAFHAIPRDLEEFAYASQAF